MEKQPSKPSELPLQSWPCIMCNRKFRTHSALVDHARSTNHVTPMSLHPSKVAKTSQGAFGDTSGEASLPSLQPSKPKPPATIHSQGEHQNVDPQASNPGLERQAKARRRRQAAKTSQQLDATDPRRQQSHGIQERAESSSHHTSPPITSSSSVDQQLNLDLGRPGSRTQTSNSAYTTPPKQIIRRKIHELSPSTSMANRGSDEHSYVPIKQARVSTSTRAESASASRSTGSMQSASAALTTASSLHAGQQATAAGQPAASEINQPPKPISWTHLPQAEYQEAWTLLSKKCHPYNLLSQSGYRLTTYTPSELIGFRKCRNCNGKAKFHTGRAMKECVFHPQKNWALNDKKEKVFTCCNATGKGCKTLTQHSYGDLDPQIVDTFLAQAPTPPSFTPSKTRPVIVLDCEMVGVAGGWNEVIRFSAVDYLTGEVLLDAFVQPAVRIYDWRSRYSGVTPAIFEEARSQGRVMEGGWREARAALWSLMSPDTILIGQALNNDLEVLRMIHAKVVDSGILAKAMAGGASSGSSVGLKTLCVELCGIEVQNHGKKGHDSVEDCLAAREVVLFMTRCPSEFGAWGKAKREEEKKRTEEEKAKALEAQIEKAAVKKRKREEENGKGPLSEELREYQREMLLDLGYFVEGEGRGVAY